MPSVARTPDGRRIELQRVVDAPPAAAWNLLVETRRWPEWGPSVTAVEFDAGRLFEGGSGRVRLPGGLWVPFEVDSLTGPTAETPGRWTWRVGKIPATGHRVEAGADGGCRVVFELPLLAAGYAPVCRRALDRIETLLE
jgi:hypothetical protein